MAEGGFDSNFSRPKKVQQLCKYFMHGACDKGNSCRFLHDRTGTAPLNNVCKFYQQGNCTYGSRCRYDHVRIGNTPLSETDSRYSYSTQQNGSLSHFGSKSSPVRRRNGRRNNSPSLSEFSPQSHGRHNQLSAKSEKRQNDKENIKSARSKTCSLNECNDDEPSRRTTRSMTRQKNQEWQSSMVTLNHGKAPQNASREKQPMVQSKTYHRKNWAKAKDFVPGQKYHAGATYAKALHKSDDEDDDIAAPVTLKDEDLLCPYYAHGQCPFEGECTYTHGDLCDICQLPKLHPTDLMQREQHRTECLKEMEKDMEHSFAVHESKNKECCICLEIVLEKLDKSPSASGGSKNQFGILENCTHCFCLDCIRRWRSDKSFGKNVRVCPICRVHSDFVTPSNVWVEEEEAKKKVIQEYKNNLGTKHCQYFKHGKGECPFNEKCFYKHAYPDGTIASPKPRRKPRRQFNANGDIDFREEVSLWDFLERRDDGLISLDDELSLFLLGLLHDSDDDDDLDSDDSLIWFNMHHSDDSDVSDV